MTKLICTIIKVHLQLVNIKGGYIKVSVQAKRGYMYSNEGFFKIIRTKYIYI